MSQEQPPLSWSPKPDRHSDGWRKWLRKTTTTGKLAAMWKAQGKRPVLAACDTFRAAACEQLKIWGRAY